MGRSKHIETPEKLWQLFENYRTKVKSNPIIVKDWVGAMSKEVRREKERPLTMVGYESYLSEQGIISDVSDYFKNKEDRYTDYAPICTRVKNVIRQDQIEGGMAGIYNPSITQRLNNLSESVINNHVEQPLFPDIRNKAKA